MTARFRHSLVIGGTGMLADATIALADASERLTSVARHADRLAASLPGDVVSINADYTAESFVDDVLAGLGDAPDLVVAWVHQSGLGALNALVTALARDARIRVVQVVGSTSTHERPAFDASPNVRYQRVTLGRVETEPGWRWLTHEEICAGVVTALSSEHDAVVGTVG